MCNHTHDVDKLNVQCDELRKTVYAMGLKKLERRWEIKRGFEAQIREFVRRPVGNNKVTFEGIMQREPNTAIRIKVCLDECAPVHGIGFSKCLGRDKWDASKGYLIAYDKAVRNAARQLAGLD